ncbi:MAG: hypothetical protein VYE64_09545 [Planctomycetota bacterium]|nr:hypothetical protein [Planctomycetota bacterium]
MSVWLTETEFRQSGALDTGITINVAFLQEIKEENVELRQLIDSVATAFYLHPRLKPQAMRELLCRVREELETYFSLEEFLGYFNEAKISNPAISRCSSKLMSEHETLFLQFNDVIELVEQIVYRETAVTMEEVEQQFNQFRSALALHEQCEMELMMRLCNEDIGVGD